MGPLETLLYREENGVAWVTLNRPEVYHAFNTLMREELQRVWRSLRDNTAVRCVVLSATGDRAFCTGIDRSEVPTDSGDYDAARGAGGSPFMFEDPGAMIGPKSNGLWKPVIAAVNGMAVGGAFYLLGEVEFIISVPEATFFDPHVTYGMTMAYETLHLAQRMPHGELARLALLGAHERMSAQRAFEIGLVSEVVPAAELSERAQWAAEAIASQPALPVQGTVRALWAARDHTRAQALELGYTFVGLGNTAASLAEGQERFSSGGRIDYRVR